MSGSTCKFYEYHLKKIIKSVTTLNPMVQQELCFRSVRRSSTNTRENLKVPFSQKYLLLDLMSATSDSYLCPLRIVHAYCLMVPSSRIQISSSANDDGTQVQAT